MIPSQFPDIDIPELDLFTFLVGAQKRPFPQEHPIFTNVETGETRTFKAVRERAQEFGKGLKTIFDLKKGETVALFTPNSINVPVVVLGIHWAGATVSPCNPHYTVTELAHQLRDSNARIVTTCQDVLPQVEQACGIAGISRGNIVLLSERGESSLSLYRTTSQICSAGRNSKHSQCILDPKEDLAFLVYSSGTTGKPKGVRLSHYNVVSNIMQLQIVEQFNLTWDGTRTSGGIPHPAPGSGGDKVLACLPFFHIYGLTMFVLCPLFTGVTTLVMERFDIEKWCAAVQKFKATFAYIVPPIALLLAKHPSVSSYDLSSIRMTGSGGAPLDAVTVSSVFERTGIRIKQGYGLSETSPGACHQRWEDWMSGVGSVGWLLPNMQMKFCQPTNIDSPSPNDNEEVGPSEVGELYLRGPNVFLGYHNNEAATRDCLTEDGWFRTGDIGFMDKNNNVHITDRVKELIKYKAFQVAPAELEAQLLSHPKVADCAVVGIYSKELQTEVPRAYVVKKEQTTQITAVDLRNSILAWMDQRLSSYKRLRGGVMFVDSIPKSPSGKILRRVIKEQAVKEMEVAVEAPRARL